MRNKLLTLCLIPVLGILFQLSAYAGTSTWTASGGGSWATAANWDAPPADGDLVVFNLSGGGTVTVTDVPVIILEKLTVNNTGGTTLILQATTDGVLSINDPSSDVNTNDIVVASGGTLTIGSNVSLDMTSSGDLRGSIAGTLNIGSGGTLNMSQVECIFTGAGTINVNSGGKIIIGSEYGLTNLSPGALSGNIQTTTRTFNTAGNYTYSPAVSGSTGNALPATVNNFAISSDGNAVSLSQSLTVDGVLDLDLGTLTIGSNTLTIKNPTISSAGSGVLSGGSSSNLTISGSGSGIQLPALNLSALTLDNSNGVTMTGALTLSGTLTLTSGALTIGSNTLTLNGAVSTTGGSLTGGASSNITIGGSGASTTLPAVALNNLTVGRGNGISLGGAVTVGGTLTLTSGAVSIGSNTLTVNGPISVSSGSLTGGASSNITFGGAGASTSLPAVSGGINNLTINRGNGISLGAGTTVNGALTLSAGALSIGGNTLTLNGTISITSGSLTGSSSSNLTIGGSGANLTIPAISGNVSALVVNRSNGVTLGANLTVAGALNFISGIVTTGAFTLTHGVSSTPSISRTSGYLMGALARYITTTTGTRTFPIGNSASYRPVSFNYTVAPTTAGYITVTHTDGTGSVTISPTLNDAGYTIDTRSNLYSTISFATISGGTFTLNMDGNGGISNVFDATKLRIIRSTDNGTSFDLVGSHTNGSGTTASRSGIPGNTAGRYYIASLSSDNALPVELVSFDLNPAGRKVLVSWKTGSEINNAGFEILRAKTMAQNFELISSYNVNDDLVGLGTNPVGKSYKFTDSVGVEAGATYHYKLVDVALDGRRTEHPVQSVKIEEENISSVDGTKSVMFTEVSPNPASGSVKVSFSLQREDMINLDVMSINGQVVATPIYKKHYSAGDYQEVVTLANLPVGSYILRIKTTSGHDIQRFVIVSE